MKKSCVDGFFKNALTGLCAALVCGAFLSCSNFSGGGDSSNRISYPTVRFVANMQIDAAAAMPQQISALRQGGLASGTAGISRSAAPGLDIGEPAGDPAHTMEYFAIASAEGLTDQEISGYTSTLELSLTSGHTWKIVCGVRSNTADVEGKKQVYLSAETTQPISPEEPVISHNFALLPGTSGSGKIYLEVYADADAGVDFDISAVDFDCSGCDSWSSYTGKTYNSTYRKWILYTDYDMPSGIYEVQIKFSDDYGKLVYVSNQTINVF